MVQPFQITNVEAGSKYIMYTYKTHQYLTPFTFIWKKSVYWSSFAIWQEKSWDNITKQLGPCLRTLYKHSSQRHLLCKQSKQYSFNIFVEDGGCWQRDVPWGPPPIFRVCDIPPHFWQKWTKFSTTEETTIKGKSLLAVEEWLVKWVGWKDNGGSSSRGHPAPLQ